MRTKWTLAIGAAALAAAPTLAQDGWVTLFDGTNLDSWSELGGTEWTIADGPRLHITLNGAVTVDIEDDTYAEGPFTLQYGSGIVRFRNVRIQPL